MMESSGAQAGAGAGAGERSDTKIFIGGLGPNTTEYTLAMHFSGYGQILESKIVTDKNTGKSKGYGFVTFASPNAASLAVANPTPFIDGKTCNCNLASAPRQAASGTTVPTSVPANMPLQRSATAQAATQTNAPSGIRAESFLETLRRQGEDLSPGTIESKLGTMLKENPARALKWFLERAEVFRGTPDLQYYLTNLVALTREYREKGSLKELPPKGSQEALSIQQEQEEKQAAAMAGSADGQEHDHENFEGDEQ
jgi:hypothetical protein